MKKMMMVGLLAMLFGCGKTEKPMVQVGDDKIGTADVKNIFTNIAEPRAYAQAVGTFFEKYGGVGFMENIGKEELIYKLVIDKANEIASDKRFDNDIFKPISACQKTAAEFVQFAELRKTVGKQNDASDAHRMPYVSNLAICKTFYEAPKTAQASAAEATPTATLSNEQAKTIAQTLLAEIQGARKESIKVVQMPNATVVQVVPVSKMYNAAIEKAKGIGSMGQPYLECASYADYARLLWQMEYSIIQDKDYGKEPEQRKFDDVKKYTAKVKELEGECKAQLNNRL